MGEKEEKMIEGMKRHTKQVVGLSLFAGACMALGMGLSYHWVGKAQTDAPVTVDAKDLDRLPPIAQVAEKLNPTVVAITNTSFVKNQRRSSSGPGSGDEFFDWFFGPQQPRSPQQPRNPRADEDLQRVVAGGSGVIISADGEILTNHHVIEGIRGGEASIEVKTTSGKTYTAKILGKDKELDIALIKIEASHLPFAKLGDSDAAKVGEWVVAIGNPLGLEHTVTQGIISAKARRLMTGIDSFLQTDAAINRGNSGGPLLNLRGEVIGINTAINAEGQNLGFAVPADQIKNVLPDLRSGRAVSRGYLGIVLTELDADFQASLGVKSGVVVSSVSRGQAADKAGVQNLDVITAVDGQKVANGSELVAIIANRRAGDTVKLSVIRDGKTKEIPVVLGDRKEMSKDAANREDEEEAPAKPGAEKELNLEKDFGFTVAPLSAATRHQYRIPEEIKGVVVTYVSQRSKASEKGLGEGMIITSVGKKEVGTLQEFNSQVKAVGQKPLLLGVWFQSRQVTLAIPPK